MNRHNLRRPHTHVDGDKPPPVNRVLQGRLATGAADDGVVMVTLTSFSPDLQRGPVHGCKPQVVPHPVNAAEGPIYATRGDLCAVILDDQRTWWMVTWEST